MISLVLVTHHSADRLPEAIASFRAGVREAGLPGEVVVVEHSEDPAEASRVDALSPDRLLVRPNRGYAAGLNAGIAAATGTVLLLGNPDIEFAPGAVGALVAALEDGWDVAGPQFTLAGWWFPPADEQTPGEELRRFLASRGLVWEGHLQREIERWRRVWESRNPVEVTTLSGALLVVHATTAARIGPWDEGYFLYFEETDWLRRARRMGLHLAVVPGARVEHAWGHAATPESTAGHFGLSRRRYFVDHFGLAGRLASRLRLAASPLQPQPFPPSETGEWQPALWLLSPSPLGFPAAGLWSARPPAAEVEAFVAACPHCKGSTLIAYDPPAERVLGVWREGASQRHM